jgi:hypothetical protein
VDQRYICVFKFYSESNISKWICADLLLADSNDDRLTEQLTITRFVEPDKSSIIQNHPFIHVNKCVWLLSRLLFLGGNGRKAKEL